MSTILSLFIAYMLKWLNYRKHFHFGPIFKKMHELIPIFCLKQLVDSNFVPFFENGTKMKTSSEKSEN